MVLDKQFPVYSEAGKKVGKTGLELDPSYVVVKTGKYGKISFPELFLFSNFVFMQAADVPLINSG